MSPFPWSWRPAWSGLHCKVYFMLFLCRGIPIVTNQKCGGRWKMTEKLHWYCQLVACQNGSCIRLLSNFMRVWRHCPIKSVSLNKVMVPLSYDHSHSLHCNWQTHDSFEPDIHILFLSDRQILISSTVVKLPSSDENEDKIRPGTYVNIHHGHLYSLYKHGSKFAKN